MHNLFSVIPASIGGGELAEQIVQGRNLRIERIVSHGHQSPETGWYDQEEHEWVVVLEGAGQLEFEDGRSILMEKGDYLHITPHQKHRVSWTDPAVDTVWLAVFWQP